VDWYASRNPQSAASAAARALGLIRQTRRAASPPSGASQVPISAGGDRRAAERSASVVRHVHPDRTRLTEWLSRAVLAWRWSNTVDQGSRFASATGVLAPAGIRISMHSRGRWMVFMERLWRSWRVAHIPTAPSNSRQLGSHDGQDGTASTLSPPDRPNPQSGTHLKLQLETIVRVSGISGTSAASHSRE
jgi:hypothetical protein